MAVDYLPGEGLPADELKVGLGGGGAIPAPRGAAAAIACPLVGPSAAKMKHAKRHVSCA